MRILLAMAILAAAGGDEDQDGLADALEQQLLDRFLPRFYIAVDDCDLRPAEFVPNSPKPTVKAQNGVIYGQAFPSAGGIELHYYHLWANDCGRASHKLDAEHVSVWLAYEAKEWRARYWYAAAHENTACDKGTAVRADLVYAAWRGTEVWVSRGKHASFLDQKACRLGCGSDRCDRSQPLFPPRVINLGEEGKPLNGAVWTASRDWPLEQKLQSDFSPELMARLDASTAVIGVPAVNYVAQPFALGYNKTADSLGLANRKTEGALGKAKNWVRQRLPK